MFLNCRLRFLQIKCIFSSKRFTREPISFPESSLPWPTVGNRPRAPRAGAKSWASWVELPRALAFQPLVNENKNSGNEITRKLVLKQRSYDNWKTAYWARVDPQCQFCNGHYCLHLVDNWPSPPHHINDTQPDRNCCPWLRLVLQFGINYMRRFCVTFSMKYQPHQH